MQRELGYRVLCFIAATLSVEVPLPEISSADRDHSSSVHMHRLSSSSSDATVSRNEDTRDQVK